MSQVPVLVTKDCPWIFSAVIVQMSRVHNKLNHPHFLSHPSQLIPPIYHISRPFSKPGINQETHIH